jgi:hypothetical protein
VDGGAFLHMMEELAAAHAEPKSIMIDVTYLKAHRTASSLRAKNGTLVGWSVVPRRHEHQGSPERAQGCTPSAIQTGGP